MRQRLMEVSGVQMEIVCLQLFPSKKKNYTFQIFICFFNNNTVHLISLKAVVKCW